MTLSRLWAFLAVALPIQAALIAPLQTVDLTYHLRAGAEIRDAVAIPRTDTWTFTAAGVPWVDQQWGAQVILTAVYKAGGWTGLVLFRAFLVAAVFGCLFEVARRRGLSLRVAAWLTLAAFVVASPALALRPQLLGMALFAVVLLLVADRRSHPRRLWAIPLVVLVWANVHGSFFLAPLVLGLAWLEDLREGADQRHRLLILAAVSVVSACLTPFGPTVWAYAVGLSTNAEVTQRITEWQRTSPFEPAGLLFYVSALALVALLANRRRSLSWPALVWLGVFFVIGAYAARGIAWWSLAVVVPVAHVLTEVRTYHDGVPERPTPRVMQRVNGVLAGVIVLVGVVLLPIWRPIDPGTNAPEGVLANAPSGITAALRDLARPGDRLFNPQIWGSWFEFAVPGLLVAIDSRIELFPPETWRDVDVVVSNAPGSNAVLDRWSVTLVVIAADDDQSRVDQLSALDWQVVFRGADGVILARDSRS